MFERPLLGAEALAMGAFPIFHERYKELLEKYQGRTLHTLGGNMFAGALIGAILLGIVFRLPWRQADEERLVTCQE